MNDTPNRNGPTQRRANTIVLVVGILVLLVIIATGYLTRTHAGRITAISQQQTSLRDDNTRVVAESLADEVAMALFPRPVNSMAPVTGDPFSSNEPRLTPLRNPVRYGIDQDFGGDGLPDYPFNFAPYHVAPFTNWQDVMVGDPNAPLIPGGPGNPNGGTGSPLLKGEGNPLGNPGFGDARWLASNEPLRWDTDSPPDGIPDAFSYWPHMTNIARPDNGWRLVADISDVTSSLVGDLSIPVEQWLMSAGPASLDPFTGDSIYDPLNFTAQWNNWFGFGPAGYLGTYLNSTATSNGIPANFYNLDNLDGGLDFDGDGNTIDPGERLFDEFVGRSLAWPQGTPRWNVGRVLADADGDGFTDSFWFLAPTSTERGIRQIVAVRIVDNSALLNVNVATRFAPSDASAAAFPELKTKGTTPADLALVGGLADETMVSPDHWNVGFFDNFDNWYDIDLDGDLLPDAGFRYDDGFPAGPQAVDPAILWRRHLDEINLTPFLSVDPATLDFLTPTHFWRLDYWRRCGLLGPFADAGSPYTPFGIPEEIELRMFHGNNYPWVFSRLERATQGSLYSQNYAFLHGSPGRVESSELHSQLSNRLLLGEPRHRITTYNGARNDLMPPWLWRNLFVVDQNLQPGIDDGDRRQFHVADMRKLDLRRPLFDVNGLIIEDVDNDGVIEPRSSSFDDITDDDLDNDADFDKIDHLLFLRNRLEQAMIVDPTTNDSYFTGVGGADATRRAAAAFAANIDAYRDQDSLALVSEAVPVSNDPTDKYLGMEQQPFLVEAAIAHVHMADVVATDFHIGINDQITAGDNIICQGSPQSTIVAVQIANPYGRRLELNDYRLRIFGQVVNLGGFSPTTLDPGQDRTYYAMNLSSTVLDTAKWNEVLDLDGTVDKVRVNTGLGGNWTTRSTYDSATETGVELIRMIEGFNVVVDRLDIESPNAPQDFGSTVTSLDAVTGDCTEPPSPDPWLGVINTKSDTHWAQWARVSRAWDVDVDGSGAVDPDERQQNPRYVIAHNAIDSSQANGENGRRYDNGAAADTWFSPKDVARFGSHDKKLDDIDTTANAELDFAMQMLHKDGDFEQVGELLNVWLFGHEIATDGAGGYLDTNFTFSESMWAELIDQGINDPQDKPSLNRLRLRPARIGALAPNVGAIVGVGDVNNPLHAMHAFPGLPAGQRVLDSFVCDGYGTAPLTDLDGSGGAPDAFDAELRRFKNAHEFSGRITPGLLNINTASPEVLRALPHCARIVHEDFPNVAAPNLFPLVRLPEAIVQYRDRLGRDAGLVNPPVEPDYRTRGDLIDDGLRVDRGIASIGEVMLMIEEPPPPSTTAYRRSWRADFAALNPFEFAAGQVQSTRISTDVNDVGIGVPQPDLVSGDVEEGNLLFSGISNLITTRSDVFTVYFKVRSFRQNPTSGFWNATDPEYIVDDSRFVMLVDRGTVDHPNDKPKIVFLEKVPK